MPTHDIIDNRKEILVDHINRILCSTESGRFAVGYFFLSGLTSIADKLKGVKALRLAQFFGTTAKFWMGLQTDYALEVTADELGEV